MASERDKPDRPPTDPTPPADVLIAWRWPLALLGLALIAGLLVFLLYRESLVRAEGAVSGAAAAAVDAAERVARGMISGNVTESFVAAIPAIQGTGAGNLELAKARTVETFTRADEVRVLWDLVSLGTTVSEIRVPVTYRYHLRLADDWKLEIRDGVCLVYAPTIRPSLPPAIHTDRMEKRVDAGWLRFDGAEQLDSLERTITPRLVAYARDQRHLDLVRDSARGTVAQFVRAWLLREDQWGGDRVRAIKVLFADEAEQDPELYGASVVFRD